MSAPLEIPDGILERVRGLCLALPEVTVRTDLPRVETRSTAYSFDIRRRSFCLLVVVADAGREPATAGSRRSGSARCSASTLGSVTVITAARAPQAPLPAAGGREHR